MKNEPVWQDPSKPRPPNYNSGPPNYRTGKHKYQWSKEPFNTKKDGTGHQIKQYMKTKGNTTFVRAARSAVISGLDK
jgi:hypothetical protein